MFAYRGIGLNPDGTQMKRDVLCYSNCNQMKVESDWISKSTGWSSRSWINVDKPSGTGDHEHYRLV